MKTETVYSLEPTQSAATFRLYLLGEFAVCQSSAETKTQTSATGSQLMLPRGLWEICEDGRCRLVSYRLLGSTVVSPLDPTTSPHPPGNGGGGGEQQVTALAKQQDVQWRTLMKLRTSQTIANEARRCSQLKETLRTDPPGLERSAGTPLLRQHPGPAGPWKRTFTSPKTPRRVPGRCRAGDAVVLKTVYP